MGKGRNGEEGAKASPRPSGQSAPPAADIEKDRKKKNRSFKNFSEQAASPGNPEKKNDG